MFNIKRSSTHKELSDIPKIPGACLCDKRNIKVCLRILFRAYNFIIKSITRSLIILKIIKLLVILFMINIKVYKANLFASDPAKNKTAGIATYSKVTQ